MAPSKQQPSIDDGLAGRVEARVVDDELDGGREDDDAVAPTQAEEEADPDAPARGRLPVGRSFAGC